MVSKQPTPSKIRLCMTEGFNYEMPNLLSGAKSGFKSVRAGCLQLELTFASEGQYGNIAILYRQELP